MELSGAVAILTGASRGIGVHLADQLASDGVHLALAARSKAELEATADRARARGVRAVAIETDVMRRDDLETLVRRASDELGPIDLLVNNAGIELVVAFHDMGLEDIERIVQTNLVAPELLTRLVVPGMIERRRGHIVNMSSISGKTAAPYYTVYSSTKHGLVGFSLSLREELRAFGVGVSVICPGPVAEVGLWASHGDERETPRVVKTVRPEKVAREVVRAVTQNRAEVVVATGAQRIVDVVQALSPDLATLPPRVLGTYDFLRRRAQRLRSG